MCEKYDFCGRALGLRSVSLVRLCLWALMSFGAVVIVHRLFFPPSPPSYVPSSPPSSLPPSLPPSPPPSAPLSFESKPSLVASTEAQSLVSRESFTIYFSFFFFGKCGKCEKCVREFREFPNRNIIKIHFPRNLFDLRHLMTLRPLAFSKCKIIH